MPQTKPIVSIENVVASATINQTVNLNQITQIFPDVEYHPDQFPGLVFRLKSPKTATLIFTQEKWYVQELNRKIKQSKPSKVSFKS